MPRDLNGQYTINQTWNDGSYLQTDWVHAMLNDLSLTLNDLSLPGVNNFLNVINVPQMSNVSTDPSNSTSAVNYSYAPPLYNVPVGAIIMYQYSAFYQYGLPSGYVMCDGSYDGLGGDTPDLREHFTTAYFYLKRVI